ncbi:MlaD family protein [Gordonia sp. CPCC 205333]|uniref:MlaD family protein n=1 Tax=Gordonia sp. CPCC 205333 TaxID=3140790 RepID=UPI003AF3964B
MRRDVTPAQLRVLGIGVILALVVSGLAFWGVPKVRGCGCAEFELVATSFGDGLEVGSNVRLRGVAVGEVTRLVSEGRDRQIATLSVDSDRMHELSSTMRTRFISDNLFGSTAIELIPRAGAVGLRAGQTIQLDSIDNYTVTKLFRDAGRTVLGVVTDRLSSAIDDSAGLMSAITPFVTSALVAMESVRRTQNMTMEQILPRLGELIEGVSVLAPSALKSVNSFARVELLDSAELAVKSADLLTEISNLVFAFAGKAIGELRPTVPMLEGLTAMLSPINTSLAKVSQHDVRRLIAGMNGALHRRGNRVELDVDVAIKTMPAVTAALSVLSVQSGGGR